MSMFFKVLCLWSFYFFSSMTSCHNYTSAIYKNFTGMFSRILFTKSPIPMRFIRQFNQTIPVESKDVKQETGTDLKAIIASKIPGEIDRIKKFRKEHGNTVVSKVTVNMIYNGMRGILGLIYETSLLDPNEGIRFRGYSIKDCQKLIPTAAGNYVI